MANYSTHANLPCQNKQHEREHQTQTSRGISMHSMSVLLRILKEKIWKCLIPSDKENHTAAPLRPHFTNSHGPLFL